jgi:hypothetical protein
MRAGFSEGESLGKTPAMGIQSERFIVVDESVSG